MARSRLLVGALARAAAVSGGAAPSVARAGARGVRTSAPVMGGGGPFDYEYLHAKKMYDTAGMPNKHLVYGSMVSAAVILGFGIPLYAVSFSQRKTMG